MLIAIVMCNDLLRISKANITVTQFHGIEQKSNVSDEDHAIEIVKSKIAKALANLFLESLQQSIVMKITAEIKQQTKLESIWQFIEQNEEAARRKFFHGFILYAIALEIDQQLQKLERDLTTAVRLVKWLMCKIIVVINFSGTIFLQRKSVLSVHSRRSVASTALPDRINSIFAANDLESESRIDALARLLEADAQDQRRQSKEEIWLKRSTIFSRHSKLVGADGRQEPLPAGTEGLSTAPPTAPTAPTEPPNPPKPLDSIAEGQESASPTDEHRESSSRRRSVSSTYSTASTATDNTIQKPLPDKSEPADPTKRESKQSQAVQSSGSPSIGASAVQVRRTSGMRQTESVTDPLPGQQANKYSDINDWSHLRRYSTENYQTRVQQMSQIQNKIVGDIESAHDYLTGLQFNIFSMEDELNTRGFITKRNKKITAIKDDFIHAVRSAMRMHIVRYEHYAVGAAPSSSNDLHAIVSAMKIRRREAINLMMANWLFDPSDDDESLFNERKAYRSCHAKKFAACCEIVKALYIKTNQNDNEQLIVWYKKLMMELMPTYGTLIEQETNILLVSMNFKMRTICESWAGDASFIAELTNLHSVVRPFERYEKQLMRRAEELYYLYNAVGDQMTHQCCGCCE